jgi:hypothetical protein
MHTVEVPKKNWTARLDEFSRVHEGWPVSLDILIPEMGAQPEFRQLGLMGVTAEPDGDGTIAMTVAVPTGGYLTHTIHAPVRVFIEQNPAGGERGLEVQSTDGTTAILRFKTAPPVNGLVRGRCGESNGPW